MAFLKPLVREMTALDVRSLALARIGLGLVTLLVLGQRAGDLAFFFTDAGCLPRTYLFREHFPATAFSLYTMSGNLYVVGTLYLFHIACALAVTLGWRTRMSTVALWVLTASLHTRNPHILDGGDELRRVVLFWAMFLPWGQVWSLDASARKRKIPPTPSRWATPWTAAFVLQLAQVYLWAGLMKVGTEWSDGSAGRLFLTLEHMLYPWSARLLDYPELLSALARATKLVEVYCPLALLIPWKPHLWRMLMVAVFSVMHLSLLLIGTFPWLSLAFLAATLALVPSQIWDRGQTRECRTAVRPDGVLAAGGLLCLVTAWNVYQAAYIIEFPRRFILPRVPKAIMTVCGLNQFWAFFSPYPSRLHGWVVAEAQLSDGRVVDLMTGQEPRWTKPVPLHRHYKNHSWRMLCRAVVTQPSFEVPLLQALVDRWDQRNPSSRVVQADLYDVQIRTALDFRQSDPHPRWLEHWPLESSGSENWKMR